MSNKLQLMKRWALMLTGKSVTAIRQQPGKCMTAEPRIGGYYNDLTGKVGGDSRLDEQGIPLSVLGENEVVYFPIVIFQYGLGSYDFWLLTSEEKYKESVVRLANWAMENQRSDGSWDSFGPIKSKKYSVSSMCQGQGASLLFRADTLDSEGGFREAGFKAIDFMLKDYNRGGTSFDEDGLLYLEEYPQMPRRSVLNGWIFSLFGLYDAAILNGARYAEHFDRSVETLKKTLHQYDNGYWSLYDLAGRIASPAYHDVHIHLLKALYKITGDAAFDDAAARFEAYQNKKLNRLKAIAQKVLQKLTEQQDAAIILK